MDEGRGGHWNRAGRRSGGDRPVELGGLGLSDEQLKEIDRRDLIRGARAGAPLALLVVTMLHFYGVEWATTALREMRRLP